MMSTPFFTNGAVIFRDAAIDFALVGLAGMAGNGG